MDPGEWQDKARCRGLDPDLFFSRRGSDDWREAVATCRACPVETECLLYALSGNERDGVWGGLLPNERRRIKRLLGWRSKPRPIRWGLGRVLDGVEHGRISSYMRGCRCAPCVRAEAKRESRKARASA